MIFRQAVGSRRVGLLAAALASAGLLHSAPGEDITADLRQAQANRLSYFHDYSISQLGTTNDDTPAQVFNGGLVGPFMGSLAATDAQTARPFFVSATPIAGYDSNPEGKPGGRESVFGGFDLTGRYSMHTGDADPVAGYPFEAFVSYNAQGALYEGQTQRASEVQQSATGAYRQSTFGNTLVLTTILSDQFTVTEGRAFLNTLDFAPAAEFFAFPQFSVEPGYAYSHMTYFYPVLASQDPDAERNTASLLFHFYGLPQSRGVPLPESPDQLTDILRATLDRATLGYGHVWNIADGTSYRYEANRVVFGLDGLRVREHANVTFDLQYAHEWQNYSYPTTETPLVINHKGGAFLERKDALDVFTLRANARLLQLARNAGNVNGFLQFDVISNQSNVAVRSFNEAIVSGGITYRY